MVYLKMTCTDVNARVLGYSVAAQLPSFSFIAVCSIPVALKSSNVSLFLNNLVLSDL